MLSTLGIRIGVLLIFLVSTTRIKHRQESVSPRAQKEFFSQTGSQSPTKGLSVTTPKSDRPSKEAAVDFQWTKSEELNTGLPRSMEIWSLHMSQSPFGSKLTGSLFRWDSRDNQVEFKVKDTIGDQLGYNPKTPAEYAAEDPMVVYACINGGFFDEAKNSTKSFLAEGGRVKSNNTINSNFTSHPTVGAFGNVSGSFEAQYIYSFQPQLTTFRYSLPNPIPGPPPRQDQGLRWLPIEGIGAGPILIKAGEPIAGNPEGFTEQYMIHMRHPRSAICIGFDGYLYLVAIDGRYDQSDGVNISQLTTIMSRLGCKDAMNLDGGGSTMLFGNNRTLNRPSDAKGPRPVVSAILLRDRSKRKPTTEEETQGQSLTAVVIVPPPVIENISITYNTFVSVDIGTLLNIQLTPELLADFAALAQPSLNCSDPSYDNQMLQENDPSLIPVDYTTLEESDILGPMQPNSPPPLPPTSIQGGATQNPSISNSITLNKEEAQPAKTITNSTPQTNEKVSSKPLGMNTSNMRGQNNGVNENKAIPSNTDSKKVPSIQQIQY